MKEEASMSHVLRCSGYDLIGIEIARAKGCKLICSDGRELVDFEAGVWCAALGHNHPRLQQIICANLERISHIGYRVTNAHQEQAAAEVLSAVEFDDGQCVFLSSGSEAVELGVQIALRVSKKSLLLTLAESYLSAYGSAGRRPPSEWILFDRAVCEDCPPEQECSRQCPHLASIPFDRIGAMVLEPGSSSGLVRFPQKKLIEALCEGVQGHGGLLVANEITTGIGRTGMWFGYQHYQVQPDIIAIGKGLGNGYPVSAVAVRRATLGALERTNFHYAQSHQNDPLGCAVATEVIRIIREEGLVERSAEVGRFFRQALEELSARHEVIREIRGRGLLLAAEFRQDAETFALQDVFNRLLSKDFLVGYKPAGNLFRFLPPLTIQETDIARMIEAIGDALAVNNSS
jgi:4-aminobutyrate aminotransferase-like enzyme